MNDAEFNRSQARILALDARWTNKILRSGYVIYHDWEENPADMGGASGAKALGVCEAHWEYLFARIQWNMRSIEDHTDRQLERAFVHELMHVALSETRAEPWSIDHEERVASELAQGFLDVREAVIAEIAAPIRGEY